MGLDSFYQAQLLGKLYIDKPTFKKLLKCGDAAFKSSQSFFGKKMKELLKGVCMRE